MFRFLRKRDLSEKEILNVALKLSLVWGKHWMAPIQERLLKRFPEMEPEEADRLNALCGKIQDYCWDNLCNQELDGKITQNEIQVLLLEEHPDISVSNVKKLVHQGMYYVRK